MNTATIRLRLGTSTMCRRMWFFVSYYALFQFFLSDSLFFSSISKKKLKEGSNVHYNTFLHLVCKIWLFTACTSVSQSSNQSETEYIDAVLGKNKSLQNPCMPSNCHFNKVESSSASAVWSPYLYLRVRAVVFNCCRLNELLF